MEIKNIVIGIFLILISISNVYGVVEFNENKTIVYLIDNVDTTIKCQQSTSLDSYKSANVNTVKCINSTCLKGWTKINFGEFDFIYEFIYDKDGESGTAIVNIIREKTISGWFNDEYKYTLKIDGVTISDYSENVGIIGGWYNPVYFEFSNIDGKIIFGNNEYDKRLFFTTLTMQDQYDRLNESFGTKVKWHFFTEADTGASVKLLGLTGIIYNVLDNIPLVGVPIQKVIFMPLFLIQSIFNFSFTFIKLIINNWWYAIMLLEIMCIIPILKYKKYPDLMKGYIKNHVDITIFIKDKIIMPLIQLIITLVVTIRNMFRI